MEQREELNKKANVKVTRQKRGTVISVPEFLSLTKPKGDLILQWVVNRWLLPVLIEFIGPTKN
jgi:hypothetical protein